jgi:hypothetical protein
MDAAIDERTARAKRLNVQRVKRHRERKANGDDATFKNG